MEPADLEVRRDLIPIEAHTLFLIYLMEIQKHLFRISQKALKSPNAVCWWNTIFYVLSLSGAYFTLVLIFGHTVVLPNNRDISTCLASHQLKLSNDSLYLVRDQELSTEEWAGVNSGNRTVMNSTECLIVSNKNYSAVDDSVLTFGYDWVSLFMAREKRNSMDYDNFTIVLKQAKPMRNILFGLDVLLINELVVDPMSRLISDQNLIVKSRVAYLSHSKFQITAWEKVWLLAKVLLCYMGISIVTSLYIYGTIVAAPAVILLILRGCNYLRPEGFNDVFKLFPWIGTHAIIRETSNTPIIKSSTAQICKAILLYFFFLYLVYYAVILWIDKGLYKTHVELGLQEMVFGFIALIEFAAIVFMRTRTFLKYYPALHTLIIISAMYYAQVCDFGLKRIAFYAAFTTSGALFAWMVKKLEIPAHTQWESTHPNTPREDRPRAGFFPLFNMGWMKNLPQQWSLLMPLFGREHFSGREMALVDRNNQELQLALGNHH